MLMEALVLFFPPLLHNHFQVLGKEKVPVTGSHKKTNEQTKTCLNTCVSRSVQKNLHVQYDDI